MLALKAQARENKKTVNKKLRNEGYVPAVFYGAKNESTPIAINAKDFMRVWKEAGESSMVILDTPKGKLSTLIHDIQFDPVTNEPRHADFYVVDKDKETEVTVPLLFEGVAPAVKELGGVLIKVMHEIEVKALPQNLPHDIKADLSKLVDMESRLLIKDLVLSQGVTVTANADEVVALVETAREEEETSSEAVDMSSIEVEKKGKKEEEVPTEDK